MTQIALPLTSPSLSIDDRPVNVSSVTQRSPFRYPGGKTWLVPRIREWLSAGDYTLLVEPFAGGGIVSLTAVAERLVSKAVMVELDISVAAVWQTILSDDASWLCQEILSFDMSHESVTDRFERGVGSTREMAFQTILKNRTFHGGILADGSAPMKKGENGRGIGSRWYPETLKKRITAIHRMRDHIEFVHGDAFAVMEQYGDAADYAFFIDPPYTAAGKKAGRRLYTHSELDHDALFSLSASLSGDILLTYDNADGVLELANKYGLVTQPIAMKNTRNATMTELLVGKNLDWLLGTSTLPATA